MALSTSDFITGEFHSVYGRVSACIRASGHDTLNFCCRSEHCTRLKTMGSLKPVIIKFIIYFNSKKTSIFT